MERVTNGVGGDGQRVENPLTRRDPFARAGGSRGVEDRYRPGTRRTAAEPLRASWRPKTDPERPAGERKRPRQSRLRRVASTYGWRIYALPILVALTALVVFETATTPPTPAEGAATANSGAAVPGGETPLVKENPAEPVDLTIPTAELPEGGEYTQSGQGTWHVVPVPEGRGEKAGTGSRLYTYTVEVEDGIDPASYGGDDAFANSVEGILSDPRSWTGGGQVALQRVDAGAPEPDFRVSLTTPDTAHRPDYCGFQIKYESSCNLSGKKRVIINLARWVRGALAFSGDLTGYRQYAINHEVGHALGKGHEGCAEAGALAPVMMQQSFGVSNDYVADLNKVDPSNYGAVPADGKVCKPNAWPNPQAR
ncbi:DUF3152 domain-containing protein [Amycolatopsis arida]|uniref:DUF3152 domain-containing protein n=1 Tax=Amycolatopsis arida TaxID=587909 RepID=UPI000B8367B6|nr:DUF3152 domain-containing protein [Amycolatopsis arida]